LYFQRERDNPFLLSRGTGKGYVHPDAHFFDEGRDGYNFWLYYTPYPSDEDELPFLMRSRDGKKFVDDGISNPLLTKGIKGSWDDHHLADPDVICVNDTWYMYYCGAHIEDSEKKAKIGVATSKDGKIWSKYEGNPILEPDPKFWWEHGSKHNEMTVIISQSPAVVYYNGTFFMWYSSKGRDGIDRISLATSRDGCEFVKVEDNPVLSPEYTWEGSNITHCDVVRFGEELWMYYICGKDYYSLAFARASIENPCTWVKHNKPVLLPIPLKYRLQGKKNLMRLLRNMKPLIPINRIWESGHIYRSSPLSDGKSNLSLIDSVLYLYYSAYDLWGIPRIGLAKSRLNDARVED